MIKKGNKLTGMNKILIFNGYYYPSKNYGGPITSIENIVNTCHDEFDFYIICYNHDFNDATPFDVEVNKWICVGNARVMYVKQGYLDFSKTNMTNVFKKLKPDLIWFSGVLTPNNKIITAVIANKMGIPILFSPRGELSADRIKLKAYKKVPYLRLIGMLGIYKNAYFHGTSDDEEKGINKYFHPASDHLFRTANIGIAKQAEVTKVQKISGELNVFFFSRIHEVKNVLFGIQCLCKCRNNIHLDIYGPIESDEYWNKCVEVAKEAPNNISIKYGGILDYTNKSQIIQEHHCFLFPTINENYGHVIAESLANCRPVLLSKGTTPWDDLDGKGGYVISLDNPKKFTECLDKIAEMEQEDFDAMVKATGQYFIEKTSKDNAIKKHKDMFKKIILTSK